MSIPTITVYKYGTNQIRQIIDADDNSEQSISLMKEDILTLNFSLSGVIQFAIGDYCDFFGKLYQVNKRPTRKKTGQNNYAYTLIMEAEWYDLGKVEFLFLDQHNLFTETTFDLRGTPQDFGDLIIYNLLRVFPLAQWKLGYVITADIKTITFDAMNCLQAMQEVAKQFNTEYIIEGKTIHIYQRKVNSQILLEYGQNKPLLSLEESDQDNSNLITRLYAFGSSRNLPSGYRNNSKYLITGKGFLEKNTALYNIFESVVKFDGTNGNPEIYPHRTGLVTSVADPLNFFDNSIDFNVNNYLVSGITPKIVFNSGLLNGYTFEIAAFDLGTTKFTINKNQDETAYDIPSVSLTPVRGDTYVIIDIEMPQSYIDKAEADLFQAQQDYLDLHSIPAQSYSVECNPKWFQDNNPTITLGAGISIKDDAMSINRTTRIVGYKRNVRQPNVYSMDLADTVPQQSLIVKFINGL